MRFDTELNVDDAPGILNRFLAIVGRDPWVRRYHVLHEQMRANPLLAPYFADSHGVELRLGQLLARGQSPQFSDREDYAVFSFLAPVALAYERLNSLGRNRIAGTLRDGLNSGLRPFKSEIETATHLMRRGFDVFFEDMEQGRGFDFLAVRDGLELEVECKAASGDLGRQVHRRRMMDLSWQVWPVIQRALASVEGGRLARVLLPGRLYGRRETLAEIAGVIESALERDMSVSADSCTVESRSFGFAGSPFEDGDPGAVTTESVERFLEREIGHANQHAFVGFRPGRAAIVLVVESRRPDAVLRGLMHELKSSARTQFSKERPGVLVVQFLELTAADLLALASHDSSDRTRASGLQIATNVFFENRDRSHIHSLVYRAQGTFHLSIAVGNGRIDRSYQEQGPTYSFKNPEHPLANDPKCSIFTR